MSFERPTVTEIWYSYNVLSSVYSVNFIVPTVGALLTPETVTEAVEEVDWDQLCWCLRVSDSKCDEIQNHYAPKDHKRVLVDWWFSTDPAPSWRKLIQRLDHSGETETVDRIRCNAEPIQGLLSILMALGFIHTAF